MLLLAAVPCIATGLLRLIALCVLMAVVHALGQGGHALGVRGTNLVASTALLARYHGMAHALALCLAVSCTRWLQRLLGRRVGLWLVSTACLVTLLASLHGVLVPPQA